MITAAAPLTTSGLAISFGAIGQYFFLGVIAIVVVTIIVRVVYRLVKGRSIREVVPPPGVRAGAADGSDPLGEQRDPLGPDAGEDQRR